MTKPQKVWFLLRAFALWSVLLVAFHYIFRPGLSEAWLDWSFEAYIAFLITVMLHGVITLLILWWESET